MKRLLLFTLLAPIMVAGSLNAASDMFLKIDGIKGESTEGPHSETIEIASFSWGMTNSGASAGGGGQGAGKVILHDMHFTAKLSIASPQLLLACTSTNDNRQAIFYIRKNGNDYYTITLDNVRVTSLHQTGQVSSSPATGESRPMEQVSLNFNSVTISYTAEDGTVTTGRAVRSPVE